MIRATLSALFQFGEVEHSLQDKEGNKWWHKQNCHRFFTLGRRVAQLIFTDSTEFQGEFLLHFLEIVQVACSTWVIFKSNTTSHSDAVSFRIWTQKENLLTDIFLDIEDISGQRPEAQKVTENWKQLHSGCFIICNSYLILSFEIQVFEENVKPNSSGK